MDLYTKVVTGTFWLVIATFLARVLATLTSIVLARILSPTDFGLFAVGLLVINTASLFSSLGLTQALIYRKDNIKIAADTTFIMLISTGMVLFLFSNISAPYMADLFKNSALKSIIGLLSIIFIANAIGYVPSSLLEKELKFKKKVLPDTVPHVVFFGISVALALKGYGAYSLVYGQIAFVVSQTLLILLVASWRPRFRFDRVIALDMLDYGKHVIGFTFFWFVVMNLDQAVVGRLLDMKNLGYYVMGYTVANLPMVFVTFVIGRIAFPTFSKIRNDPQMLKVTYLKALGYTSMIVIPASIGIFLISQEFVTLVLGDKWAPSVIIIRVLCLYSLLRSLSGVGGHIFLGTGSPEILKKIFFGGSVIAVFLIPLMTMWMKLFGTALAVVIIMLYISAAHVYYTLRFIDGSVKEIARMIYPSLVASVFMTLVIILLKFYLSGYALLTGEILIGFAVYVVSLNFILQEEVKTEMYRMMNIRN